SMDVGKSNEAATRLQDAHRLIENLHLQGLRECRPWESRDNAIDKIHAGIITNHPGIGGAVLEERNVRMPLLEQHRHSRMDFDRRLQTLVFRSHPASLRSAPLLT